MPNKKVKNLRGYNDDSYIISHNSVGYSIASDDRYKHIDELLLYDDKLIKATLGPMDTSIVAWDGFITEYVVPDYEENRIDLISLRFYGSSKFYWILCYFNNIKDPLYISKGTILIIPNIECIRKLPNPLS